MSSSGIASAGTIVRQGGGRYNRHTPEQGERSEHLPPDHRANRLPICLAGRRGSRRTPEPDDVGVGELLQSRTGRPRIPGCGPARDPAAATVVLSEAQGAIGGIRAFSRPAVVDTPRPYAPGADDQVPSVGEGMIPTESRMRENRTPGSTSRGWKRTYGRRTMHRRESVRRTPRHPKGTAPAPDSTVIRATRVPLTVLVHTVGRLIYGVNPAVSSNCP